jgi:cell division septal protein FtsQ
MKQSSVSRAFLLIGVPAALGLVTLVFVGMEARRYLLESPRFAVKSVELLTKGPAQKESVLRLADVAPGTNIFSLDLEAVQSRVERDPWIQSAAVSRALPDRILIRYEQRKPVAILGAESMYYLSADGIPFYRVEKSDSLAYPFIQVEGGTKDTSLSRKRVEFALQILERLKNYKIFDPKDLGELTIRMQAEDGAAPYLLSLRYPPKALPIKANKVSRLYTLSLGEEELERQLLRWDMVVRYLVQQGKNPRLIRLELGKKVVVKVER